MEGQGSTEGVPKLAKKGEGFLLLAGPIALHTTENRAAGLPI